MTWPPIIRVFFAIEFEPAVILTLKKVLSVLKKNARLGSIRWTKPQNFHITLKFIPTLYTKNLPQLEANIDFMVKKYPGNISLQIENCIALPHSLHPRVIALEVLSREQLLPLVTDLNVICDNLPLAKPDERSFRPHITLGRVKHPKEIGFPTWKYDNMPIIPPVTLKHITLFRSEPFDDGSHYTVIKRFPLGESLIKRIV